MNGYDMGFLDKLNKFVHLLVTSKPNVNDTKEAKPKTQKKKERSNRSRLQGGASSLEIDIGSVLNEASIKRILIAHAERTCSEIDIIPQEYRPRIAKAILDNFYGTLADGRSLLEELQSICTMSKQDALLIARDQTSKLNGRLTQARQEAIGIDEYIWRTTGTPCGFVGPEDQGHKDHYDMDHTLCKWSDASVYSKDGGKTWIKRMENNLGATPGCTFLCRCFAMAKPNSRKILAHARKQKRS
jgi:hypothetical protein